MKNSQRTYNASNNCKSLKANNFIKGSKIPKKLEDNVKQKVKKTTESCKIKGREQIVYKTPIQKYPSLREMRDELEMRNFILLYV